MTADWVTPGMREATKLLNLTHYGQIRLACYSDKCLQNAVHVMKRSGTKKESPFRWFASVCNKWCHENNESIDWGLVNRLSDEIEIPPDPVLVKPGKYKDPESITASLNRPKPTFMTGAEAMALERKKSQQRIATRGPEAIKRERIYLASTPDWIEKGKSLGVSMSQWEVDGKLVLPETTSSEFENSPIRVPSRDDSRTFDVLKSLFSVPQTQAPKTTVPTPVPVVDSGQESFDWSIPLEAEGYEEVSG